MRPPASLGDLDAPLDPEAVYGILVNVIRFRGDRATAHVAMVYGPLPPADVVRLLRAAADELAREHGLGFPPRPGGRGGVPLPVGVALPPGSLAPRQPDGNPFGAGAGR